MPTPIKRKISREVAVSRARLMAAERHDRNGDHAELRQELAAATWLARIERLVAEAPPLSDERRLRAAAQLATVLGGAHVSA